MDQLFTKATFNLTDFQANEANRWHFLEPEEGAGLLLESPRRVLLATALYLSFVCLVGPLWMRNREPFQLKSPIRFYNLLMVFLAGYLLYGLYQAIESLSAMFDYSKMFTFADMSATRVYQMGNFILLVRISEYLDTIFFTLRKKYNQVTFLHVFHHTIVPIYAYWIIRTAPLRFNVYIIVINSFIHVLMYFYYFLATFQVPREHPSLLMRLVAKLLMFKKYMTQLQILQFVSLAAYALWAALRQSSCQVPWTYIVANLLLAFGFLALFVHFYLSVYKSAAAAAAASKRAKRA